MTHLIFLPCAPAIVCTYVKPHRYAKKQVLDESGTLINLLQLWQLVVRHPDVFYESRAQFVPQMINTLSRIGMPTTASLENR